jgi:hypothetical protein
MVNSKATRERVLADRRVREREPVLSRAFGYWKNIDPDLGKKIEEGVRANLYAR